MAMGWAVNNATVMLAAVIGLGSAPVVSMAPPAAGSTLALRSPHFSLCHTGGGINCVVDGDTVWMGGEKIRLADIDAPETHQPRCAREAALGRRATLRLQELVNRGGVSAVPAEGRRRDRYGRKLMVLMRDGKSVGGILVREGFARSWDGARHPWC